MDSNALVPFKLSNNFYDPLRCEERLIDINGTYIRIKQSWKSDGKGGTSIGFGASVYNCSIVLAYYFKENAHILKDTIVLELGSGTGFLSIALKILGASQVICTDGDVLSVEIAKENIHSNFDKISESELAIKALKLYWGDESDQAKVFETIKSTSHRNSINCTNTNTFNSSSGASSEGQYPLIQSSLSSTSTATEIYDQGLYYPDIIVGSDIIALPYSSAYTDLVNTLRQNCSKHTVVFLCYQRRHYSEDRFFELLKEFFEIEILPQHFIHNDFADHLITIYKCKLLLEQPRSEDIR